MSLLNRLLTGSAAGAERAATVGAESFLRKITLYAGLQHPHILPLLDSGHGAGFFYYVMPNVEGQSLRNRLNREKQLCIKDAIQITRAVADALGYAHDQGVIHLNIKPENILLDARHGVVVDFEIPRVISVLPGENLTAIGVVVGTPEYMSPEQATGARQVDHRSDVYSLACILYEMLIGDPPFVASNVRTLLAKVAAETPTPIGRLRPNVPAPVEVALGRALAKLPANRFATARQFADALEPQGTVELPDS